VTVKKEDGKEDGASEREEEGEKGIRKARWLAADLKLHSSGSRLILEG
jgi:hypothetical protein